LNRPGLTVISHRLRIPEKNREKKGRRAAYISKKSEPGDPVLKIAINCLGLKIITFYCRN